MARPSCVRRPDIAWIVNVYRGGTTKPKRPIYSFSLNPGVANSLVVDRHGNLFLADTFSTWVFEYAPGTFREKLTGEGPQINVRHPAAAHRAGRPALIS